MPTNSNTTSRRGLAEAFNSSVIDNIKGPNRSEATYVVPNDNTTFSPPRPGSSPINARECHLRTLTFSYRLSFDVNASEIDEIDYPETKIFTHCIKARNGIQDDLYSNLENNTEIAFAINVTETTINVTETFELCSDEIYESLIVFDLQNAAFNAAFDAFSEDLVIDDASKEEQCGTARESLGYETDYIDDFEICREFYDIQCDFNKKRDDSKSSARIDLSTFAAASTPRSGGQIPDFEGFTFQPLSFQGFDFEEVDDFVGFDFKGFKPSNDLLFNDVRETNMEEAGTCK